jgi:hypothetical protein
MTNWNYYYVVFEKVTRSHFVKVILGEKKCTGGTESGSRTLWLLFLSRIIENKNLDFVMAYSAISFMP